MTGRPPSVPIGTLPWVVLLLFVAAGCSDADPTITTVPVAESTTSLVPAPSPVFVPADSSLVRVGGDASLAAQSLVSTGGRVFLFSQDRSSGRVVVWSTEDGLDWTDHGDLFPEGARMATSMSADGRVVVVTVGPPGANPSLWSSSDGVTWDVEEIPVDSRNGLLEFTTEVVTVDGPVKVLAGIYQLAAEELIESKIRDFVWPAFDRRRFGLNIQPVNDEIRIEVLSPLGLKLITTTATELGLSDEEQEWIRDDAGPSFTWEVWVGSSDGSWAPTTIDGAAWITSLASLEGTVLAAGDTGFGASAIWTTTDGYIWEQASFDLRPYQINKWNDRLVGPSQTDQTELLVSDNGLEWESTGLGDYFAPGQNWFMYASDATEAGLVASFGAFYIESQTDQVLDLPQIEKDGIRVLVQEYGRIQMVDGDDEYIWSSSVSYAPDQMSFDPTTETVHFFRADGTDLVSLTLGELETLSDNFFTASSYLGSYVQTLAFSNDAQTWTIWDSAQISDDIEPSLVTVIDSMLVVVGRDRTQSSGFGIWTTQTP